ncbi:MAG: agmatine deiminase family protein [Cellulosilyticaceae bacterium]
MKRKILLGLVILPLSLSSLGFTPLKASISTSSPKSYYMPLEDQEHEGTWLQWPHEYTYGKAYQKGIEDIWVKMTQALTTGEKVHIIAYNATQKKNIETLLQSSGIDMQQIDFYIYPTDDVWVRDNGPIFVYDEDDNLTILDWGFNGWGKKTPYKKCEQIPNKISKTLGLASIDLNGVVLEGGAMELDGSGTFLATKSSILNRSRNPHLTQAEFENYMRQYYNIDHFVWLDGVIGVDITDMHIDGFAKFYDDSTLITFESDDLLDWGLSRRDIKTLYNATNAEGIPYEHIYLPLTQNNVRLKNGKNLGYKGSYINFYIGNTVVLVPNYNDPNDHIANQIIQQLYPDREVVGIDIRQLYKDGGMIHCITQQQPISLK